MPSAPPAFRLKQIRPALRQLKPALASTKRDTEGHSDRAEPWRPWYKTRRWKALRLEVFLRDRYTCQLEGCGRIHSTTSTLTADHVLQHRGDPDLFWNQSNLQTLCTSPCHVSVKQAEERRL